MAFLAPIIGFLAVVGPAVVLRYLIQHGAGRSQLVVAGIGLAVAMLIGIVLAMGFSTAGLIGVLIGCGVIAVVLGGAVMDALRGTVGTPLSDRDTEQLLSDSSPPPRQRR